MQNSNQDIKRSQLKGAHKAKRREVRRMKRYETLEKMNDKKRRIRHIQETLAGAIPTNN